MFLRTKTVRGTAVLQLVESYRNPEGLPRQRVLASLGDASVPVEERGAIAKSVELRLRGEEALFPVKLSRVGAEWVVRILKIAEQSKSVPLAPGTTRLDGVIVERVRTDDVVGFGPHVVALKAWEDLGLSAILDKLGMEAERIAIAQLMVVNRLVEPLSEWALIDWSNRTALPEMLGVGVTKTTKDRLYRTSDELLKIRRKIEKKLRHGEQELFSLRRSIVLYDVTNTHFEGLCKSNPKAKHGKNKQKRNDCRQVALGMAFDEHGFALAHEVFEGNMADTKTLLRMLDRLDLADEGLRPVVILDAGFASEENIKLLEERGCSYIVNITRGSRSKYAEHFENETFSPLPGRKPDKQVEVKRIDDPGIAWKPRATCGSGAPCADCFERMLSRPPGCRSPTGAKSPSANPANRMRSKSGSTPCWGSTGNTPIPRTKPKGNGNDFVVPQKVRTLPENDLRM